MNRLSYFITTFLLISITGCTGNHNVQHGASPYAGQEAREIKALTSQEIEGYRNGLGMGLSKVAELNHYPGPKHVIELADKLELSQQQRQQTEAAFSHMKKRAVEIGETYIAKERELNALFEADQLIASKVDSLLIEIGKLKGSLRATHINAHIKMKDNLTPQQINKYDELRGYGNNSASHEHHQSHRQS